MVSSTLATINVTATDVEITVRASNNPHGTVEFASAAAVTTSEGAGPVLLNVVRLQGLVGALQVNFTVSPMSADGTDYNFTDSCKDLLVHYMLCIDLIAAVVDDLNVGWY